MQTFLPYPDFRESARVLDSKRLGKQRVEAYQILLVIQRGDSAKGWKNHPAVKMWRGNENALIRYGIAMCDEWIARGYNDTLRRKFLDMYPIEKSGSLPRFIGNRNFHVSHRSNLLRKDIVHYRKYWPALTDSLPYVWPVR